MKKYFNYLSTIVRTVRSYIYSKFIIIELYEFDIMLCIVYRLFSYFYEGSRAKFSAFECSFAFIKL